MVRFNESPTQSIRFSRHHDSSLVIAWQALSHQKSASTLPVTTPIMLIHNGMGTIKSCKHSAAITDGSPPAAPTGHYSWANGITHIGPVRQQMAITLSMTVNRSFDCWHINIPPSWRFAVNQINPLTPPERLNGELRHCPQEIIQV